MLRGRGRGRPRWTRLAALAAVALALSSGGCAGSGHRYGCDAGECGSPLGPDGGHPNLPPFLSPPVVVARDGRHNGFTDVTLFAGQIYAAYRHASYRGFDGAAEVRIARSPDKGRTWAQSSSVSLPGYDLRDPKLTAFRGKLLLTFTAWDVRDPTQNRSFVRAALSADGDTFGMLDPPSLPQPFGLSAWRPRSTGDDALLLPVWTADELLKHPELDRIQLLRSTDGQSFLQASELPIGGGGSEPELLVRAGGKLLLTAPEQQIPGQPQRQSFCRATLSGAGIAPWDCFTVAGPRVETPLLYEWSGTVLLFGRHDVGDGKRRTAVWQVVEDEQRVQLLADLDTYGDTGAPGLLPLDANTALLLYYTTSAADPQVMALGHEPTELESIRLNLAADVMAMTISLASAPIGN